MTNEEQAELSVLQGGDQETGIFVLEVGSKYNSTLLNDAFDRGLEREWFRLIDVRRLTNRPPHELYRVFQLSCAGRAARDAYKRQVQ